MANAEADEGIRNVAADSAEPDNEYSGLSYL